MSKEVNYLACRHVRDYKKTKLKSGAIEHERADTYSLISRKVFRTHEDCKSYCDKHHQRQSTAFVMECNFPMPDTLVMTDTVYENQLEKKKFKKADPITWAEMNEDNPEGVKEMKWPEEFDSKH